MHGRLWRTRVPPRAQKRKLQFVVIADFRALQTHFSQRSCQKASGDPQTKRQTTQHDCQPKKKKKKCPKARQDRVIDILYKHLTLISSLAASFLKNKFLDLLLLSTCKSEQLGCFPFPAVIYIHGFARPPAVREVGTG